MFKYFDKESFLNESVLYKIRENSRLGRYLVTNDEILSGEVIIEELPYAIGPILNSKVVCLECYCPVESDNCRSRCPHCKWPLCENCVDDLKYNKLVHHKEDECTILKRAKFQNLDNNEYCPQLDCITPLRVLLKKQSDPERWEKEVAPMEYHDEPRRKNIEIWNADLHNVAKYLRGPCKLTQFSEELIMRVIGILEVNAFEARTVLNFSIRALYPITGILAHDCTPNTMRSVYPSDEFRIRLRAMVDIKAGEQLKHSYTHTLIGTSKRLEHLRNGKFFICECARCSDPTEFGTNFSSIKCENCDSNICSKNPFDNEADAEWICGNCNNIKTNKEIREIMEKIDEELLEIQNFECGKERLICLEKLREKFLEKLPKTHYIITTLNQELIENYGRTNIELKKKENLCRQILELLNKFEPGLGRQRAYLNFQLYQAIFFYSKSEFELNNIDKETYKIKLMDSIRSLYECQDILQFEDPASMDGNMCRISLTKLNELTKIMDDLNLNSPENI